MNLVPLIPWSPNQNLILPMHPPRQPSLFGASQCPLSRGRGNELPELEIVSKYWTPQSELTTWGKPAESNGTTIVLFIALNIRKHCRNIYTEKGGVKKRQNIWPYDGDYDHLMIRWCSTMIIRSMVVSIMMAAMRGAASMSQQYWRQLGAVINIVQFSFFLCGNKYCATSDNILF